MKNAIFNIHEHFYQELESEADDLFFNVLLDDRQLTVYSQRLVGLILRACTEIESISIEFYDKCKDANLPDKVSFQMALKYISAKFSMRNRFFLLSYPNSFLSDKNRLYRPFLGWEKWDKSNYEKGELKEFGWNCAYQNLKHDLLKDKMLATERYGTIKVFLSALCMLYALNCLNSRNKADGLSLVKSKFFEIIHQNPAPNFDYMVYKNIKHQYITKRLPQPFADLIESIKDSTREN